VIDVDLSDIFAKYEALRAEVDAVFNKVKSVCPHEVRCAEECSDCCHAPFDVTLVEALYINTIFNERFAKGDGRYRLTTAANEADREHYRLKHKAWKAHKAGIADEAIIEDMAKERIRCALLAENNLCELYDARPITCRLYGVPLDVNGALKVCGKSGFTPGGKYPAVKIAKIQDRLFAMSHEIAERVGGRYDYLAEMLVPVSMAMLTKYDDVFFGLVEPKEE